MPHTHECSPVNLLHTFRTPFPKSTSGGMLLKELMRAGGNGVKSSVGYLFHKRLIPSTLLVTVLRVTSSNHVSAMT